MLFYLSGCSEAASAKARLGAFREKLIYQAICCIPGVLSGAHRLSFLITCRASGGSYFYYSEDRLLHSIYTPKFSVVVVVLVWQYLLHLETPRQKPYYPRCKRIESNASYAVWLQTTYAHQLQHTDCCSHDHMHMLDSCP